MVGHNLNETLIQLIARKAAGGKAALIHKSITENGNYDPADEDPPVDGYNYVSVSVETYEDELAQALADLAAAQAQIADYQACQQAVISKIQEYDPNFDPQGCSDIVNKIDDDETAKQNAEQEAQECNDCKAQVVSKIQQYVPNFNPQTCQDMVDAIDDVYDAGGGGGTPKYTFPPGATYPDIYALCADDYITDEDVGLTLKYTFDNSGRDKVIRFFAVNTTTQAEEYIFRETSGVREYESATLQVTDPTTGEVQVTYHWHPNYDPSDHRTTTRTYTYGFLVGFGTNGHTYSVEDSGY